MTVKETMNNVVIAMIFQKKEGLGAVYVGGGPITPIQVWRAGMTRPFMFVLDAKAMTYVCLWMLGFELRFIRIKNAHKEQLHLRELNSNLGLVKQSWIRSIMG